MLQRVCDICQKNYPKHKFKVKKEVEVWDGIFSYLKYERIDICDSCYHKLINAKSYLEE